MTWWQRLWQRRNAEKRLDAELRDHIERLVADNIASGMTYADAMRDARLTFGGLEQVKDDCRDSTGTRWLHDVAFDFWFALRAMKRDLWFTTVVTVSLALGIGVCSMAFTITDAYFAGGLPVPHPDRMLHVGTIDRQGNDHGVSMPDYLDWRAALPDVDMGAYQTAQVSVAEAGSAADRVPGVHATADVFRLLDVNPVAGRVWNREDELADRTAVAVLGYRLWTDRFGRDKSLPGRTILVNGLPTVVLGVMPQGFGFPSREEIWLPLASAAGQSAPDRSARDLAVLARLNDDQSPDAVASAWRAAAVTLARIHPTTNTDIDVDIVRFGEHQVGRLSNSPALMLPVTAAIVLLIACINVATLLLAHAGTRTRELAIRASVGATRSRIVRQLLTESVMLAAVGGLAGFGLATLAVDAIAASFFEGYVPYWMTFTANSRSLAAVGTFAVVSTVIFGLTPALRISRRVSAAYARTGTRSGLSVRTDPWSARLVAIQFALAVVLLGGAGLLTSSYGALLRVDGVIDARRFTTMRLQLPEETYPSDGHRSSFYRRLEEDLASTPGVERVALASTPPFLGASARRATFRGRGVDETTGVPTRSVAVSSGYFDTLGLALVKGRPFDEADGGPQRGVAIVNELFAERHFAGQDPLGQEIRLAPEAGAANAERPDTSPWLAVVGIAPTIRQAAPGGPGPIVYVPQHSAPALSAVIILRTASTSPVAEIRRRVGAIDDQVVLTNVQPLTTTLKNSRLQPQLIATVIGSLGLVALFLSTVGLYAITAHGVAQRRAEIGLRLALGGRPAQVIWLFVRRGLTPIVLGLAVGLAGALGVGQLLRGALIGTSPADPATFMALSLLLVVVTLTACFFPALRGARVDPASILRQD